MIQFVWDPLRQGPVGFEILLSRGGAFLLSFLAVISKYHFLFFFFCHKPSNISKVCVVQGHIVCLCGAAIKIDSFWALSLLFSWLISTPLVSSCPQEDCTCYGTVRLLSAQSVLSCKMLNSSLSLFFCPGVQKSPFPLTDTWCKGKTTKKYFFEQFLPTPDFPTL